MAKEQLQEVKTYQVNLQCEECKEGKMLRTGRAVTKWHIEHEHKCSVCNRIEWYENKHYPHLETHPTGVVKERLVENKIVSGH